jgi:hypothetical protein
VGPWRRGKKNGKKVEEAAEEKKKRRHRTNGIDTEAVDATVEPEDDSVAVDSLGGGLESVQGRGREIESKRTSRTSSFSHLRSGCSGQK